MDHPKDRRIPITREPQTKTGKTRKVTKEIEIDVDKTQMYLFENRVIKDEDRIDQAVTNNQELVIVSDGVSGREALAR